jgi:hypothetical protein
MNTTSTSYQATGFLFGLPESLKSLEWNNLGNIEIKQSNAIEWQKIVLQSKIPLAGEFNDSQIDFFSYLFFVRTSGNHVLIVSERSKLVEWLLKEMVLFDKVIRPRIHVAKLVKDLTFRPGAYTLSGVFANVDGYGKLLQSISLYGNDLAQATFFKDNLYQFIPFRVTLREVVSGKEIISIGVRGETGFYYSSGLEKKTLEKVIEVLSFLNKEKYIEWPVGRQYE